MLHGGNYDDDVTESSIFDLDHAPAPRVSSMMSPQHHNILLQQPLHQHPTSDSMLGPQPPLPPLPPPVTSFSMSGPNTTASSKMSPSLSPRPSIGSIGRSSRKSIVIPVGEYNHVVSLPPTAPPTGTFTTTTNTTGTTSKDSNTLSSSLLAPITFNRRRLSSFSSIPTVGGSYMYGPSVSTNSGWSNNASIPSHFHNSDGTPRIANTARTSAPFNHTTRQRSYSAAAVFSNTSMTAVPSHLAHVRSFPPPSTGTSLQQQNETTFPSPSLPNNSSRSTVDSLYGTEMYSPSFGSTVPIIRIEEAKEPLDGDHSMDDVDVLLPLTDSEYESDILHERTKDKSDILMSDTGFSSGSEQPTSSLFLPTTGDAAVKQTETTLSNSDPTFQYQNDLSGNRNYDFDDSLLRNSANDTTTAIKPVMLCGCIPLPHCFSKRRISWDRVASFIAVWSPCFVCFRMEYSTYRAVLFRLNVISGFMAIVQLTASSFHFAVLHSRTVINRNLSTVTVIEIKNENDNKFEVLTNVWNLNGSVILLGLVALVVFVAVVSTIRAIQNVNLAGAIRYYWLILWVMPLQAFWAVSMFDYFHVTQVWIKFWWRDRTMAWYRYQFCHPSTTYNTQCAVPVYSNPDDETAWCQRNYNSTTCTSIRDNAQAEVARFLYSFYSCNSAWTILFMISLFLVMKTLESIITSPLVEKSRESSIPSWLMLPMAGCFICGFVFTYSPSSILNLRYQSATHLQWIAPIFMIAGAMFFTLALLAWLLWTCPIKQTSHKRNKSIGIVVFILISFAMILIMATIFASCIVESLFLDGSIADSIRGPLACSIDQSGSCTFCPDDIAVLNSTIPVAPEDQCPEWSNNDVLRVLQSQAKTGANLAVICMLYAIGAFRYGLTVRKHIMNYKIAYV